MGGKKMFFGFPTNNGQDFFIGGIGVDLPDASSLAARLTDISYNPLTSSDIKNFTIDADNNISFRIDKEFITIVQAFDYASASSKYAIYLGDKLHETFRGCFRGLSNMRIRIDSDIIYGAQCQYSSTGPDINYYPNITDLTSELLIFANWRNGVNRLYIPKVVALLQGGNGVFYNYLIRATSKKNKIYVNPFLLTNNGGSPDARIQFAMNQGGNIISVTNFTIPSNISDLSIVKTSTTATFNFTPPSSFNALDFYEIWIKEKGVFNAENEYMPNRIELTASGQTLTGLNPDTDYIVKIASIDYMYNGSGMSQTPSFSNEIEFKTDLP